MHKAINYSFELIIRYYSSLLLLLLIVLLLLFLLFIVGLVPLVHSGALYKVRSVFLRRTLLFNNFIQWNLPLLQWQCYSRLKTFGRRLYDVLLDVVYYSDHGCFQRNFGVVRMSTNIFLKNGPLVTVRSVVMSGVWALCDGGESSISYSEIHGLTEVHKTPKKKQEVTLSW